MSRCFFRELVDNNIAFLPEGLFDNLINLYWLWVNTSLSSLSHNSRGLPSMNQEISLKLMGERNSELHLPIACNFTFR